MGRSEDLPVSLGDVLDGKYRIEAVIGSGGMGVVFAGRHVQLDRLFAIKVMRPSMSANEEAVVRFDREARACSALESDHIAHVLEVGRSPAGDPYIVMEHLVGTTLKNLVMEEGARPVEQVVDVAIDVIDALVEAHGLGIIHRDLKPANIFLIDQPGRRPTAKVLDFGIAKVNTALGEQSITTTGSLLGTPEYMSPEQLDTKRGVTPKTDVWALGVTMYYALTTKAPFEADSIYELSIKVYAHDPTPITAHRTDLPPALVEIIGGCLQKDAKKRLSLDAVSEKLARLRRALPAASPFVRVLPASDDTEGVTRATAEWSAPASGLTQTVEIAVPVRSAPAVVPSAPLARGGVPPEAEPAPPSVAAFAAPTFARPPTARAWAAVISQPWVAGLVLFSVMALVMVLVVARPPAPARTPVAAQPAPLPPQAATAPTATMALTALAATTTDAVLPPEPEPEPTVAIVTPPSPPSSKPAVRSNAKRRPPTPAAAPAKDNGALTHER